jgi:peptide-methionine (R)-S-oxide reductase
MSTEYRTTPEALSSLTRTQYRVTQDAETEPAFRNRFWDNKDAGIYVDVVSGEPLFASTDIRQPVGLAQLHGADRSG